MSDERQVLENIRDTIFYIEAAFDGGVTSMGSAVLVELQNSSTKKRSKYLLTCVHSVCDVRVQNDLISLYASSNIRCWKYEATYAGQHKTNSFRATISDISPLQDGRTEFNAEHDWVLLEVESEGFQRNTPVAARVNSTDEIPSEGLIIVGYPGGKKAFKADDGDLPKVLNKPITDLRRVDEPRNFEFEVVTNDTERGMSGGGCFSKEGVLVGLHRHGNDDIIERTEIRVDQIAAFLKSQTDFRFVSPSVRKRQEQHVSLADCTEPMLDGDFVATVDGEVVVDNEIIVEEGASLQIAGSGKISFGAKGKITSRGLLQIVADDDGKLKLCATSGHDNGIVLQLSLIHI